jgi:hypothetical protein
MEPSGRNRWQPKEVDLAAARPDHALYSPRDPSRHGVSAGGTKTVPEVFLEILAFDVLRRRLSHSW